MSDVPEPKEPYQRKLMAFIAPIPAVGGADIVSGTPALPNPTEASLKAIKGKTRTDPHFKAFTGYEGSSPFRVERNVLMELRRMPAGWPAGC